MVMGIIGAILYLAGFLASIIGGQYFAEWIGLKMGLVRIQIETLVVVCGISGMLIFCAATILFVALINAYSERASE